jgi:hypothetical protein
MASDAAERRKQARLIIEEIGPLMDAWDGLPNDVKDQLREDSESMCEQLDRIAHICEFGSPPSGDEKHG